MKKLNKIFLSLTLVLILTVPMLAGCSLSDLFGGNNNNTQQQTTQKKDLETTVVDCRYYYSNYYYHINFENNTNQNMTFYRNDFLVHAYDKRDGHEYATFQVDFYNYTPANSNPYSSQGNSFVINANSNKTMAIQTSIYVYGNFTAGVTLKLYYNQSILASFDADEGIITNIR